VAAAVLAAGVLAGTGRAAAQPAVLYAAVTATGTGDCSDAADACTLSTALGGLAAGVVVELVTPGGTGHYVGNWTVFAPDASASAPVTIEAAPGLPSQPVLDGNSGASSDCSTASCNGPVLTVRSGQFVALSGITITGGNNTSSGEGGGLDNTATLTITGCTFTGNNAFDGGAIDNGDGSGRAGTVTVTQSTFSSNTGTEGGAIDNGDDFGGGTVAVTASTFTGNAALDGAAIDNGEFGGGTVAVTASTFTGNTASDYGGAIDNGSEGSGTVTVTASTLTGNTAGLDGGAIDNGDSVNNNPGTGTVTVTASTFTGNTAVDGGAIDNADTFGVATVTVIASTLAGNSGSDGGAIDNGDFDGDGTARVAGDVFDGSCNQAGSGTWADGGYNAGSDGSCFNAGPGDLNAGSSSNLDLGALASNGGPTQTVMPGPGPLIGMIPFTTTVTLGGSQVNLCPTTDQRGYPSATPAACDTGAVQTFSSPPGLTLKDSATPGSFNQAGQVITYHYKVTNTGAGTLSGIAVTDPAAPGVSCPVPSLAPGTGQTCTGSHTITAADLAAGKVTGTATASGATTNGVPVASSAATVTVPEGWPPVVTGTFHPAAGAAEGYYLGATTNTWQLRVTHPGTAKVTFTGQISVPAGTLGHLTLINPGSGHQVNLARRAITFSLPDSGKVTGFSFTTGTKVTSITFTLTINGQPATTSQIYLGASHTQAASGSPITFTRP
jgi:hypothetical protein